MSTAFAIAVWEPSTRAPSLAIDAVSAEPDLQAVPYPQVFKLTPPGSATLLKYIHAVPSAALTQFDRNGALLRSEKMSPIVLQVDDTDEQTAATQLRDHLIAAKLSLATPIPRPAVIFCRSTSSRGRRRG
ncbi:MAG: hypothetical protein ABIT36_00355 [Steroidobacteraceae bacterium]